MLHSSAALVFRTHATFGLQSLEGTEFSSGLYSFHIPSEKQWECSRSNGMLCPMIFRRTALCSVLVVRTIPLQKQWNNVHSTLLLLYCSCSRVRKCRAEEWCSISSWLSGRLCNVHLSPNPSTCPLTKPPWFANTRVFARIWRNLIFPNCCKFTMRTKGPHSSQETL